MEDVSPSAKDERIGNLRGASKPIKTELTQKAFGEALVLCASWLLGDPTGTVLDELL